MLNISVHRSTQRTFAKEKDLRKTILFCGSHPAFRVGVPALAWRHARQPLGGALVAA
jgi:hypothetical protein